MSFSGVLLVKPTVSARVVSLQVDETPLRAFGVGGSFLDRLAMVLTTIRYLMLCLSMNSSKLLNDHDCWDMDTWLCQLSEPL
jgi:hypothetical protein